MNWTTRWSRGPAVRAALAVGVVAASTMAAGCDVTNPGPVQDEYLNNPKSHDALVTGAERKLVESMNWVSYTVAVVAREVFPGGETTGGHSPRIQGGALPYEEVGDHWKTVQQARFIAEDALERFKTNPPTAANVAQAHIWAGYANRMLGENWCEVVFDGGAAEPPSAALKRAEAHFAEAIANGVNDTQRNTARAGRAQVRVLLGDWAGAAADAGGVPAAFVQLADADGGDVDARNKVYWANANLPYRWFTMHFTNYYDYYTQTRDPRVAWVSDPKIPVANASLQGFGQVPWSRPLKYNSVNADYRMASGREMLLIRAEAILMLTPASWPAALDLVNQVRTTVKNDRDGATLAPAVATNAAETWTALMKERGIELHMEGRRMADLRRWDAAKVPGNVDLPNFESKSQLFVTTKRATCFPIPKTERDANTNLPPVS